MDTTYKTEKSGEKLTLPITKDETQQTVKKNIL